jgi:DNA-binding MarR family transcriptional regulator
LYLGRYFSGIKSAESQIINAIALAGNDGISKSNLLLNTSIDQSTAYRITQKLEKQGNIQIIRKGQRTSYRLLSDLRVDIAYGASILGRSAIQELIGKNAPVIYDEIYDTVTKESKNEFVTVVNKNTTCFQSKFKTKDVIEEAIFSFSNRIGAYVTYVLISGMDPDNKFLESASEKERDRLVREWINNALSPAIISRLLWQFNDLIYSSVDMNQTTGKGKENEMNRHHHVLTSSVTKRLYRKFAKVYPSINERLVKITNDLTLNAKLEREYEDQIVKQWETCKEHEFGAPTQTLFGYGKQCTKCYKIERVKKPKHLVMN